MLQCILTTLGSGFKAFVLRSSFWLQLLDDLIVVKSARFVGNNTWKHESYQQGASENKGGATNDAKWPGTIRPMIRSLKIIAQRVSIHHMRNSFVELSIIDDGGGRMVFQQAPKQVRTGMAEFRLRTSATTVRD